MGLKLNGLKMILKNIKKLVDMDIKDLHKLCESVEEKCIHKLGQGCLNL